MRKPYISIGLNEQTSTSVHHLTDVDFEGFTLCANDLTSLGSSRPAQNKGAPFVSVSH